MADKEKKEEVQNQNVASKESEEVGTSKLSDNAKKVLELVEGMNVLELNDLVKVLEKKFGVSAQAPVAVAAASPADQNSSSENGGGQEKTSFDVVLSDVGESKINVIKAVREVNPQLGLIDAKNLVESAPKAVLEGAKKEDAEEAKKKLEAAGAKVELK